jgi:hypothetical protein
MKITKTNDQSSHFLKMLVYAGPGDGKTRLCATTDDPEGTVIISAEAGLLSLRDYNLTAIEVKSLADVAEAFKWISNSEEGRRMSWVCLDSISEIAEVVLAYEKSENKNAMRAYGQMADQMQNLIRGFRDLPGKHVYMTCKQERTQLDDGSLVFGPSMPGKNLTNGIGYYFDELFCLRVHTSETGEITRYLQTASNGSYQCKDRSGALELFEEPNLTHIKNKILNRS